MQSDPIVIIGAGIGGLTTAAYLSRAGVRSILLEKTGFIGGKCSTRWIDGNLYEVGAIYLGGGVFNCRRDGFGVGSKSLPIRCGIRAGRSMVSFPLGPRTLWEIMSCGVSIKELTRFMLRSRIMSHLPLLMKYESVGHVFDYLAEKGTIFRRLLDSLTGLSGASPYSLPSGYLYTRSPIARYQMLNPMYPVGGNGQVTTLMAEIARKHCDIRLNTGVNKIILENDRVIGVKTTNGNIRSRTVVSNAGLRTSVLQLTDRGVWDRKYYEAVRNTKETLKVVNVFLTFEGSFKLPERHAVFLMPYDVSAEFETLELGRFPEKSMYILHVPSNVEHSPAKHHRATLQFYYPRGSVDDQALTLQVERIVSDGLDDLFAGLSRAVTSFCVFDPSRYESEFGFPPNVFGLLPEPRVERFPIAAPVKGLFFCWRFGGA